MKKKLSSEELIALDEPALDAVSGGAGFVIRDEPFPLGIITGPLLVSEYGFDPRVGIPIPPLRPPITRP